jgi:hypothetical protein
MAAIQAAWPIIPKDAIEYFCSVFAEANRVATEHIVAQKLRRPLREAAFA